jgi:capsular exopolysaccharide synthesis family protein
MTSNSRPDSASLTAQAGSAGAADLLGPTTRNHVWDYVRTLVKHRWWALSGFLALFVPVVAVSLATTPVYSATTRLLVSEDQPPVVGLSEGDGTAGAPAAPLDPRTQLEVVRSRGVVREAVESLRLWEAAEFSDAADGATTDAERAQRLVEPFLGQLSVEMVPDSRLIAINFESTDPGLAARAANALATRYIERDRESRFTAATDAASWLTRRLAEQRQQVAASETALQSYREKRDALSLQDRQNIVVQKLGDLNAAVTKAKTDRIIKETQYRQLQTLRGNTTALETQPLVASNTFVQSLKNQAADLARRQAELTDRFGPKHPEMVEVATAMQAVQTKLRGEIEKVVDGVRSEYAAALAQERDLTAALESQKAEALALDRKGVEYAALEREAASSRQVFDALLQQTKEAALSSDLQRSSVRVVDAAEPPSVPIRPQQSRAFVAALALGLLGALGSAFGREYLRTRVGSPQDVEKYLGLPLLALVPLVNQAELERVGNLPAAVAEAFRRLRTSVLLAGEGFGRGKVLVVTSSAPREGKTIVAAHLAATLAAADQQVLLIDADLRRPRLHMLFGREREPGLTDVLQGKRSRTEVLTTAPPLPALIAGGTSTANASELLSLPAFRDFIESLRSDFDWIVIDSPPILAVTDGAVLAHGATHVLFVTSAEQTPLEAAEVALGDLTAAGANLIGAVLNRAPLAREAYYYSRYYSPEYTPYFSAQTTSSPVMGAARRRSLEGTSRMASAPARGPVGETVQRSR